MKDFYPRPPRGGRRLLPGHRCISVDFYPRPPRGGRPPRPGWLPGRGHFYPRPPRGGRRVRGAGHGFYPVISIHALREEGDYRTSKNPLSPSIFLSTPSARRATVMELMHKDPAKNFYPRPPRGGRRFELVSTSLVEIISIHALREEGDRPSPTNSQHLPYFYPRPPRGGRLLWPHFWPHFRFYFYPRPPRGGRPIFQHLRRYSQRISIHALREEGDSMAMSMSCWPTDFYPRPPRGGRLPLLRSSCLCA